MKYETVFAGDIEVTEFMKKIDDLEYQRKEEELKWVLLDLDLTIANTSYPEFKLQEPIKGAREFMKKLVADGFKITIFTARPWTDYEMIEKWLDKNKLPFRRIICGKPLGRFSVDDRNIEFSGDFKKVYNKIKKRI